MYLDKIHRPRPLSDVITKAISNSTRTIKAVQLRKNFPFEVTGIANGNCNISMNSISKWNEGNEEYDLARNIPKE